MTTTNPKTVTREQLHDTIWELTAKQSGKDRKQLDPKQVLTRDLGLDSLDVVELSTGLADRLGVDEPEDLLSKPDLSLGELEQALWERRPKEQRN
jgi:acyl carrier protein